MSILGNSTSLYIGNRDCHNLVTCLDGGSVGVVFIISIIIDLHPYNIYCI